MTAIDHQEPRRRLCPISRWFYFESENYLQRLWVGTAPPIETDVSMSDNRNKITRYCGGTGCLGKLSWAHRNVAARRSVCCDWNYRLSCQLFRIYWRDTRHLLFLFGIDAEAVYFRCMLFVSCSYLPCMFTRTVHEASSVSSALGRGNSLTHKVVRVEWMLDQPWRSRRSNVVSLSHVPCRLAIR
jgi:hypothetical protein